MLHAGPTLLLSAVRAEMGSVSSYEAGILGAEAPSENPPVCNRCRVLLEASVNEGERFREGMERNCKEDPVGGW